MAHTILAHPNHVDSSFYSVVFSGGNWQLTLPLTNLADPRLAKVARSTDAALAATQFDVDLGTPRSIRVFAIPRHNITIQGRIRIRASNTAGVFTAPAYDTGWIDVWTEVYAPNSVEWEHPSFWFGKLSGEEAADYDIAFIHVASASKDARYWRFEIDDTANPDGYVELSRLFMAPGWQPTVNMGRGAELGVETDTTVERSLGGIHFYDRQKPRRVARFTLPLLGADEALGQAFEMQRQLGIDRQLFYIFDPADTYNLHRRSFLGTIRELTPLEFPYVDRVTTAFQLEEVL